MNIAGKLIHDLFKASKYIHFMSNDACRMTITSTRQISGHFWLLPLSRFCIITEENITNLWESDDRKKNVNVKNEHGRISARMSVELHNMNYNTYHFIVPSTKYVNFVIICNSRVPWNNHNNEHWIFSYNFCSLKS